MGYDLRVTRGDGKPIAEAEWRACVGADPELDLTGVAEAVTSEGTLTYANPGLASWRGHPSREPVWFDLRDGEVFVKNPDERTIAKMLDVARALEARVQGDDGEFYESAGAEPTPPPAPSLAARVGAWLGRLRPAPKLAPEAAPFAAGERVRDFLGQAGTVVAVDTRVNHGMGRIDVRFDDGRQLSFSVVAHGLEPIHERSDG